MVERVVVCFRAKGVSLRAVAAARYAETARGIVKRAAALGGRLIAWEANSFAFDFGYEDVEDAFDLVAGDDDLLQMGPEFSVGIAQGELDAIADDGSTVALSWGVPLLRAAALAKIARAGEVLVEPNFEPLKNGDLLTCGSRLGVLGKDRLRGVRLDRTYPWRYVVADAAQEMTTPLMVGRPALASVAGPAGSVTVIRADRGMGGTRFLGELARHLSSGRVLRVAPSLINEPLGALRRSLVKSQARAEAPVVLDGALGASLEALLAGEGLDMDSVAELLRAWLETKKASGALLVDDAGEVDADTLDAVAFACRHEQPNFRVVIRLAPVEPLPPQLVGLPVAKTITLAGLKPDEAAEVAGSWLAGELNDKARKRWAKLSAGQPLAIAESLAEGLESGELVWDEESARPRVRKSGRGRPQPAAHFIERRLRYVDVAARSMLTAIAVLGGEAETSEVEALMKSAANVPVEFKTVRDRLEALGWLRVAPGGFLAISTKSQRDVVLHSIDVVRLAEWHRAAAAVVARNDRPLTLASAAAHAALGGDAQLAARHARKAAAALHAVGLTATAEALEGFGKSNDPTALTGRGLSSVAPPAVGASGASAVPPEALMLESGGRSSYPPVALPPGVHFSDVLTAPRVPLFEGTTEFPEPGSAPESELPQPLEPERFSEVASLHDQPVEALPSASESEPSGDSTEASTSEDSESAQPAERASEAVELAPGDIEAVELEPEDLKPEDPEPDDPEPERVEPTGVEPEHVEPADLKPEVPSSGVESDVIELQPEDVQLEPDDPESIAHRLSAPVSPVQAKPTSDQQLADVELADDDVESVAPPDPIIAESLPPPSRAESNGGSLRARAQYALTRGNVEDMPALISQLRSERAGALADRLEAMVQIKTGQTGAALRTLRAAADAARRNGSQDGCRTALALGIGLAAAGRNRDALLEALDALARARAASDARGEHACARFLGHLAQKVGHKEVAERWNALAESL